MNEQLAWIEAGLDAKGAAKIAREYLFGALPQLDASIREGLARYIEAQSAAADRLADAVEAAHKPESTQWNGQGAPVFMCVVCDEAWPCEVAAALAAYRETTK